MARPFKIFLTAITLLVALLVIAAVVVALGFDANKYRPQITAAVKEHTGRDLAVGDIKLSVFPWLRLRLSDAKLSNAAGFGDEPFAQIAEADVGVRVLPLFQHRLEVGNVSLDGLQLHLARKADGHNNWQDLAEAQKKPKDNSPKAEAGFTFDEFGIGGISLKNTVLSFRDEQAGENYRLQDVNLETGALKADKPFDIDASLRAIAETQKLESDIKLSAHVIPDLHAQKAVVENLKLETHATRPDLDAQATLTGRLAADLKAQLYEFGGLKLVGNASGKAVPNQRQDLTLTGELQLDQAKGTLRFKDAVLEAAGIKLSTDIEGKGLSGERPQFSGPISVQAFSPRDVLSRLGRPAPTSADETALRQLSFSGRYAGTGSSARLEDVQLALDGQTHVSGHLAVSDFASQALEFELKIDKLDADRYLPPSPKNGEKPVRGSSDDIEIPVDALRDLNVNGTLGIADLKLRGMKMNDVRLKIAGPKGAAKQASLDARLYGGQLSSSARLAPVATPEVAFKAALNSVELGALLKDLSGKDRLSGKGSVDIDLHGSGKTVGQIKKGLDGELSLSLENGAFKGVNVGDNLRRARAMLRGEQYTSSGALQTDFAAMTFKAQVVDGILKSDHLDGRSPALRLAGHGQIDLKTETLDYTLEPTVVETSTGQGGRDLEDLRGLTIPVRLTGSLDAPKFTLDLQSVFKQKAADKLRERLQGRGDVQKLNERLGGALDSLLNGRKKKPEEAPADPKQESR